MGKPEPIDLEKWFSMDVVERANFLLAGGELEELSRIVLITCDSLRLKGAIISDNVILDYYKSRKELCYL